MNQAAGHRQTKAGTKQIPAYRGPVHLLLLALAFSSPATWANTSTQTVADPAFALIDATQDERFKTAVLAAAQGQAVQALILPTAPEATLDQRLEAAALALKLAGWRLREVIPMQVDSTTDRLLLVFDREATR